MRQLGQYEDSETGLYYNRFRYYDCNSGLYISKDPIGLAGNNPNFYAYVGDSNTEVDVFGLLIRVFWSGGREAQAAAEAFAKSNGGNILEMTFQGKALEEWTKGMPWDEAKPLWTSTSADFAGSSTGTAHAFINEPKYRGAESVWEATEMPILKKKGSTIIEHRIQEDGTVKTRKVDYK